MAMYGKQFMGVREKNRINHNRIPVGHNCE